MAHLIYKGLKANLPVSRETNSFYLCTDTKELYFGADLYTEKGVILFESADLDVQRDFPSNPAQGVVYFDKADNSGWLRDFTVTAGDPGDWVNVIASTESVTYQIRKVTTSSGAFATYALFQGGVQVPTTDPSKNTVIDIPKDFLVKSATLGTVTAADKAAGGKFENDPTFAIGDKYIDFVVNSRTLIPAVGEFQDYPAGTAFYADQFGTTLVDTSAFTPTTDVSAYFVVDGSTESHIYLNVKDLGIALQAGDGIELAGANEDEITIKLYTGYENGLAVSSDGLSLGMAAAATTQYVAAEDPIDGTHTYYSDTSGTVADPQPSVGDPGTGYYVAEAVAAKNGALSGIDKGRIDTMWELLQIGTF